MLKNILSELACRRSSSEVFNQYRDPPLINNLGVYFRHLQQNPTPLMLVGEAPGYRGCRLTGIPFTSENVVRESKHPFFMENRGVINVRSTEREATATILWGFLGVRPLPLIWNAFPFHPHKANETETNRSPTEAEIQEGKKYLCALREIFRPRQICSIGRVGNRALSAVFPNEQFLCIRHPANGGKREFVAGMVRLLDY
jgi:hypothetical protein